MGVFHVALTILCVFSIISTGMFQMTPSNRNCTSSGSFDIVEDATCQSYYLCIFDGTSYTSYDSKCASGMVFYPAIRTCTTPTVYNCTHPTTPTTIATTPTTIPTTTPTTIATTPTTTPTTIPTTTPTTPTTTTIAPCTASGRFRIPDPNCKLYYFCYVDGATVVQYYNLTCPNSLQFNPQTQKCVLPNTFNCTATGG